MYAHPPRPRPHQHLKAIPNIKLTGIDPLDGTVNFAHLSPFYCVSIAFLLDSQPVIGIVCAPFLHQTFSALRNHGAWLNGTTRLPLQHNPVPPLPPQAPKGCIFSCEWGKDRRDIPDGNLARKVETFVNLATELGGREGKGGMVHGVRSLGSATLDLCYVAMGGFDIWWEGVSLPAPSLPFASGFERLADFSFLQSRRAAGNGTSRLASACCKKLAAW